MSESILKQAPTQRVEDTGLSTVSSATSELAPTRSAAAEQFEVQSAIVLARRFPRNEDQAFALLMKACGRPSFAEVAEYSFLRAGQNLSGPSVHLAREAARVWGNIRYGLTILRNDEDSRQIEGWAWDLETNTKVVAQDDFRKLVQRKNTKTQLTVWVRPDERDLRELTNRRGAILVRNCILQLLPSDLIEDARTRSAETMKTGAEQDPEGARKKVILGFGEINVTPVMLEIYLSHPLAQCSPAEIANLRKVFQSIRDGNSTWDEYANAPEGARKVGTPTAKSKSEGSAVTLQCPAALTELDAMAEDAGVPPMAIDAVSQKMFNGRSPAGLTDAEFAVLKAWVKNSEGAEA